MKKSLTAMACAAALVPGIASAKTENSMYFDLAETSFTATSTTFEAVLSWIDLLSGISLPGGTLSWESDGLYSVLLRDSSNGFITSQDVTFASGDVAGKTDGTFTWKFSSAEIGETYTLSFFGQWMGSPYSLDEVQTPSVAIGTIAQLPVPEPETYAMLLAGLGMVGVIARRRRQS